MKKNKKRKSFEVSMDRLENLVLEMLFLKIFLKMRKREFFHQQNGKKKQSDKIGI